MALGEFGNALSLLGRRALVTLEITVALVGVVDWPGVRRTSFEPKNQAFKDLQ